MHGDAILTAAQMRSAEQLLINSGVPEYALMERAGAAAAEIIWRAGGKRDLLVLCGPGNNGGDGFVIARLLRQRGVPVRVAALGDSRTESSLRARSAWDGPVETLAETAPATQIVDALFGTGLSRGLDAQTAASLQSLIQQAGFSYAVDLPSGVDTDSGALLSAVPHYGVCIALGALKPAHLLQPSAGHWRRLVCADIGIDASDAQMHRLSAPTFRAPDAHDHKYSRGLVAVVGGEMAGAGWLASHAAARAGAGMVRHLVQTGASEGAGALVTQHADDPADLAHLLNDARIRALLVGPGLGRGVRAAERLRTAVAAGHPLVLDADSLSLLGTEGAVIPAGAILTPHEGEFVCLFGQLPGSKIDRALAAAERSRSILIYKGSDTVIATPDGRAVLSSSASPWLSTAGTGDVLAGLVAARLAVTADPFRAACEAVWLHGEAARRAGPAFIADDLLDLIPAAIASRL